MHTRSLLLYFVNKITSLFPPSRFYKLKAYLYIIAGIQLDSSCRIVSSANIWGVKNVHVGRDTFIGYEVLIAGGDSTVTIGSGVDIAPRVTIITGTHDIDMQGDRSAGTGYSRDIVVEDGVWIGAGVTVIGGVTIGRKSIIGAGSVVTKSVPPLVIAVGNPCLPIKQWDSLTGWKKIVS